MQFIKPSWPAPENIFALTTTRQHGYSLAPYASLNVGDHVGDNSLDVEKNRQKLLQHLPAEPIWLKQTHSNQVIVLDSKEVQPTPVADASVTSLPNTICAVQTADCLPILMCNRKGTFVSAIHAGWRSLAAGIIENTMAISQQAPNQLLAWLGPAIGPRAFEVSTDVLAPFVAFDPQASKAFSPIIDKQDKWLANLYLLATQRLNKLGITAIFGGQYCTFSDSNNFYSYRRDGITGRMASMIWLSA